MFVANLQMHKISFRLIFTKVIVRIKQIITCGNKITKLQKILCIFWEKQSIFQYLLNHRGKSQRSREILLTVELAIMLALYTSIADQKEIGAARQFAFNSDKLYKRY